MSSTRGPFGCPARWMVAVLGGAIGACVRMPSQSGADAGPARTVRVRDAGVPGARAAADLSVPAHWRLALPANARVQAAAAFGETLVVLAFDRPITEFPSRRWSQFVRSESTAALEIRRQRRGARDDVRDAVLAEVRNPSPGWALAPGASGALSMGYQGRDPEQEFALRFLGETAALDRSWTWKFPREHGLPVRPGLVPMLVHAGDGDAWVSCARVWQGVEASVRCARITIGTVGPWHVLETLAGYDPLGVVHTPAGIFAVGSQEAGDAGVFAYRAQRIDDQGAPAGAALDMGTMHFTRDVLGTMFGPAVLGRHLDERPGGLLAMAIPERIDGAFAAGMTGFPAGDGALLVDAERGLAQWSRGGILGDFRPWPAWIWTEISRAGASVFATPEGPDGSAGVVVWIAPEHEGTRTVVAYQPDVPATTGI